MSLFPRTLFAVRPNQNQLEIRVKNRYFEATESTVPVMQLLIDGIDLFSGVAPNGFIGFDPDELLGPDDPLIPAEPARRVAVYRCSCGEPGCGVVAPVISGSDTQVWWRDFQDSPVGSIAPCQRTKQKTVDRYLFPN